MADGRARGPGVFALAGAVLGLVFLLAAAAGAATGHGYTVVSPESLTKDSLNGANIVLRAGTDPDGGPDAWLPNNLGQFVTLHGVPAGVNLSISNFSVNNLYDHNTNTLTLSYSGNFTNNWNLTIQAQFSAFDVTGSTWTFGPIPVYAARHIVLNKSTMGLTEGNSDAYTVRLSQQPTGNVQVRVARNGSAIEIRNPGIPSLGIAASWTSFRLLTFTANNWNTPQTVQVRAPHDANAADAATGITHSIVQANTVADFDNAPNKALTVNVTDDETAAIVLSRSTPLAMTEGDEATYTVRLSHEPTAPVRVVTKSHTPASLRVSWQTGGPYYEVDPIGWTGIAIQ